MLDLVLFAGIVFSGQLFSFPLLAQAVLAFVAFCLASSTGYIFNDLFDADSDQKHPLKRLRPLTSGKISQYSALLFCFALIIVSFCLAFFISRLFFLCVLLYATISFSYTCFFKRLFLLDIFSISFGFVVRAIAGCVAILVIPSSWLLVCTFLLALLLALGKRKKELLFFKAKNHYSLKGLNKVMPVVSGFFALVYLLYAVLSFKIFLFISVVPVFIAIDLFFDYSERKQDFLEDRTVWYCIFAWIFLVVL